MTPILYSSDEIDLLNNGLGQLVDLYDVDIQEQRNGLLNLTAYYPVNGQHYADISEGNIILAKPSPLDDNHAFRIVNTQLDISGYAVQIEADSITYDLTHNIVKSVVMQGDGQNAMKTLQNAVLNPSIFTFYSDITATGFSELNFVNPMEAIAGIEGSFLQKWGGELKRENRRVAMFNRRGRDNVATFRLGKNISGLKYTVDTANLVTQIIPTVTITKGDASRYIEGTPVSSKRIGNYPVKYMQQVDLSDAVKVNDGDSDDTIRKNINSVAAGWFTQSENTGKDLPQVTVEVDVLSLQDSADYSDKFAKLETIGLTDTVTVYVPEYGVNVTAIVNELHYDPIGERVTSLVVGTAKVSFADANKSALSDLENKVTQVQEQATQAVTSANGKNSNYYGRNEPTHPQEGDLWYWDDGENSGIKQFVNGEWIDLVDTQTNERIGNAVDSAVSEATSYADSLNSTQASIANSISASTASALASASTARSILASNASSMANSAASKGSSAANSAYTAAMSGAAAAVDALSSDVGVKITSTADSLNGKLATAITSANVTASSYATVARNEAIATASQNTATITSAAISNFGSQVASAYVTNTTFNQTVSGIQLAATQLQTQVNAMGQVNQLTNTEFSPDFLGWTTEYRWQNGIISSDYSFFAKEIWRLQSSNIMDYILGNDATIISEPMPYSASGGTVSISGYVGAGGGNDSAVALRIVFYDSNKKMIATSTGATATTNTTMTAVSDYMTPPPTTAYVAIKLAYSGTTGTARLSRPMMVFNSKSTGNYVPGNYNNNARVSSLEVTVDGITGVVNDPSKGLSATWNLANSGQTLAVQASNAAAQAITTANAIQTKVSKLGAINRLLNTEFDPDLQSWVDFGNGFTTTIDRKWLQHGSNNINLYRSNDDNNWRYKTQTISASGGVTFSFGVWAKVNSMVSSNGILYIHVRALDDSHGIISDLYKPSNIKSTNGFEYFKVEGLATPTGTEYLEIALGMKYAGDVSFNQPMLSFTKTLGDYVPGNYSNNDLLESYRTQLAGQITDEVANRTSGDISVRTQLTDLVNQQVLSVTTGYQTAITQASNAIMASVSGVNLFTFSGFEDSGNNKWPGARQTSGTITKFGYFDSGNNGISVTSTAGWQGFWHSNILVSPGQVLSASVMINNNGRNDDAGRLDIWFVDKDDNRVSQGGSVGIGSASGWAMAKIENMTVPSDAAYMQVSLLNGIATGPTHYALPMVNVGAKALPYTPDVAGQTALQLFADNFALSLTDNIGNIISGINGDTSGLNIVGKKITVSGDTTFIGNNFMDGAIIKSASIGTAQIADAAINSAKISYLDVSKLSGNITNFVKSYWSNAYQNLQIDANAIDFTTPDSRTKIENGAITMWQNAGGYYRLGGLRAVKSSAGGENNHTAGVYLALDEWQTTKNGDKYWNYGGPDFFGGSEIGLLHSTGVDGNGNPTYGALMKWSNALAAGRQEGISKGFNFFDDINFQGNSILVNGAANKMKFTWVSWSDWGNYHLIALTNETAKAGIAMNSDNLVLFGIGKRADATGGWKV
ncbi:hypothetical protein HAU27_03055 [Weissella confusa]|uniref:phage tail spike protein n=1 Tax=Weissella confusa TaxID=1583 RepID=UPI00142DD1C4|nr:phage tail spike protein [Weissella confusa]MBJ7694127.1 hypothetical protein [Weissella confusa]